LLLGMYPQVAEQCLITLNAVTRNDTARLV
jgi:hypothetical protein